MEILAWIINTLLQWYVWIPIVLTLAYLTWRNNQSIAVVKNTESVLLVLEIPKANDKSELAAEQLFASLHGILRDAKELKENGGYQEHLSFEILSDRLAGAFAKNVILFAAIRADESTHILDDSCDGNLEFFEHI